MDRSIFSTSSGGLTRNHSPERVREKLAELESNLSALGHVGIVKHQRDILKTELLKQTYLTDHARNAASSLRKLALRLAIHVSVNKSHLSIASNALAKSRLSHYREEREKESSVKQLLSVVRTYERQGEELLRELSKHDGDKNSGTGSQPLHLPSPPPSPRSLRSSARNSSGSDLSSGLHFDQLPSEVLEICQERVRVLLQESRKTQHTVAELQDAKAVLKKAVQEHEEQKVRLEESLLRALAERDEAENQLLNLRQELQGKIEMIARLDEASNIAEQNTAELHDQIKALEGSSRHFQDRTQNLERELLDTQYSLKAGQDRLAQLQDSLSAKETLVTEQTNLIAELRESDKKSQHHLDVAESRANKLTSEYSRIRKQLEHALEVQRVLEDENNNLEIFLETSRNAHQKTAERLEEVEIELAAATDAQRRIQQDLEEAQDSVGLAYDLEMSLRETIQGHEEKIHRIDAEHTRLHGDFVATRSMLANFAQTAARLGRELESEKERTQKLDRSESALKSTVQNYEQQNSALHKQVRELEQQLASEQADHQCTSQAQEEIQAKLEEAKKTLWNARMDYEDRIGALIAAEVLLKGELEEVKARSRNAEGAKTGLESVVEEHKAELKNLRREHEDKIGGYLAAEVLLKAELDAANSRRKAAEEAEARLQSVLEEMKASAESSGKQNEIRLAELQEVYAKAQQQLEQAHSELDALKATKSNLIFELESERQRNAETCKLLEGAQNRATELEAAVAATELETQDLRRTVEDLERAKATLQGDLRDAQLEFTEVKHELQSARSRCDDIQTQLQAAHRTRNQLSEEMRALQSSCGDQNVQLEKLEKDLTAALESSDLFRLSSTTAESKLDGLQEQISQHEIEVADLLQREADYRGKLSDTESSRADLEQELTHARSVQSNLETAQQDLTDRLSHLNIAKDQLEEDLRSCKQELLETQTDNATLMEELARLNASSEELKASLQQAETRVAELQHDLQISRADQAAAEKQVDELCSQVEAMRGYIIRLEDENQALTEELEEQRMTINHLRLQQRDNAAELAAAAETTANLTAQLEETQESIKGLQAQYNDSVAQLREAKETNSSLVVQLDECRKTISSLQDLNRDLAAATNVEGPKADSESEKAERERLSATLESLRAENRSMRAENQSLQNQVRRSRAIRSSHEAALGTVRVRLNISRESQKGIQAKLSAAQKDFDDLRRHNDELKASLASSVAELNIAKSEKEEYAVSAKRVKELEDTISDLQRQDIDGKRNFETAFAAIETELATAKQNATDRDVESAERLQNLQAMVDEMQKDKIEREQQSQAAIASVTADLNLARQEKLEGEEALSSHCLEMEGIIETLRGEKSRIEEQLIACRDNVRKLEEELKHLQVENDENKMVVARLNEASDEAEAQICQLEKQLAERESLHDAQRKEFDAREADIAQVRRENEEIVSRLRADVIRMNERHSLDLEAIRVKEDLIGSLKSESAELARESQDLRTSIVAKEAEIRNLSQQICEHQKVFHERRSMVEEHDAEIHSKNATIEALREHVETQRRQLSDAQDHVTELEQDMAAGDSHVEKLRKLNRDYASLIGTLQKEVHDLRTSKERLDTMANHLKARGVEGQEEHLQRATSAPILSVALVPSVEETLMEAERDLKTPAADDFADSELEQLDASPSARRRPPSSTYTRVDSSYSDKSLKAYRVLGVEAAAGRLHREGNSSALLEEEGEMKKKLEDLWEEQRAAAPGSRHGDEGTDKGGGMPESIAAAKRARRKLQKRYRVTSDSFIRPGTSAGFVTDKSEHKHNETPQCKQEHEHGRVWNLVRFGSFRKRDNNRPVTRG